MAPLHKPHQEELYVNVVPKKKWGKLITDYDQYDEENDDSDNDSYCSDASTSDCSDVSCDSDIEEEAARKRKIKFDPVVHIFVLEGVSHMTKQERRDTWYNKKDYASFRKDAKSAENKQGKENLEKRASWKYYAQMTVLNEQDRQRSAFIAMSIPPCDEVIAALYKEHSKWAVHLAQQNGKDNANDAKMTNIEKARMYLALQRNASRENIMQDALQLKRSAQQHRQEGK